MVLVSTKFVLVWTFFISHVTWREQDKVNCSSHGICFSKSIISHWHVPHTSEDRGGKGSRSQKLHLKIKEAPKWDHVGTTNLTSFTWARVNWSTTGDSHGSLLKELLSNTKSQILCWFTWMISSVLPRQLPPKMPLFYTRACTHTHTSCIYVFWHSHSTLNLKLKEESGASMVDSRKQKKLKEQAHI